MQVIVRWKHEGKAKSATFSGVSSEYRANVAMEKLRSWSGITDVRSERWERL